LHGRGYQTVRFGPPVTPNVIKQLLIANLAVFVAQALFPVLWQLGSVTPYLFWRQGYLWQPFTYMWLHAGLMHIAFNMLALWMFGSPIALLWGEKKFLRFYLLCGFGAGLIIVSWPAIPVVFGTSVPQGYLIPTLGASGAVFGVLLAYSLTWPDRTIMLLFPPIPIKAIYFIPFILVMGWVGGPANVSHVGHLGGVVVGWILLRRMGTTGGITFKSLQHRWRRYKMRRNLRAVRMEELRSRRRSDDDHRTFH
jgi:membrane associated rhomboid family serine protease